MFFTIFTIIRIWLYNLVAIVMINSELNYFTLSGRVLFANNLTLHVTAKID